MRTGLLLLSLLIADLLCAQGEPQLQPQTDAELWLSTAIETKPFTKPKGRQSERRFFKNFRSALELGYRGNENLTSSKLFYTTLALKYKVNDWCRFTTELRHNARDKYTSNSLRLDVQMSLTKDLGRVTLGSRTVYQHEFVDVQYYRDILRERISIGYNIPKFPVNPYVSAEPFYVLHYTGNMLIGMRYDLGVEWSLSKDHSMELAARYDREINLPDPLYRWIAVVSYAYYWRR